MAVWYACRHGGCREKLERPGRCPRHAAQHQARREAEARRYDAQPWRQADREFYQSAEWQAARAQKLASSAACEVCGRPADTVHHRQPRKLHPELALDQANLMAVCRRCHKSQEPR